jgi:hypothetical protein
LELGIWSLGFCLACLDVPAFVAPPLPAANQGARVQAGLLQRERRTGARVLGRSGTVENDRPLRAAELRNVCLDLIERDRSGPRDVARFEEHAAADVDEIECVRVVELLEFFPVDPE